MKPLFLEIEAFGPFANKQSIDFSKLNESELFLVTGATGSGKTSIFDAITFVLYNKTSGDGRNVNNLKSDYSLPTAECYVKFCFENKGEKYTIRRRPNQQVIGRGEKLVDRVHEVELHLPNGDILTAVEQVREKIEKIIGLDYGRFSQIVMLPQGKFKKFLESKGSEKQYIFREVFLTHKYKDLSEYLKNDADELLKKLDSNKEIRNTYISMIKTDNTEFLQAQSVEDKDIEKILALLKTEINNDEKIYEEINEKIKILRKKQENLDVKNAILINEKINRIKEIKKELLKLKENNTEIENKKIKLNLSNKALQVNILFNRLDNNKKEEKDIVNQIKNMNISLKKNNKLFKVAKKEYEKNNEREKEIEIINKKLEEIKLYIKNLKIVLQLDERIINGEKLLKNVKNEKEIFVEQKKYFSYTNNLENLEKEKKALDIIFTLQKNIENTYKKAVDSKKIYDNIYALFMSGQAAMLALNLIDGKPCEVCGSTTHPKPAKDINNAPSKEKLDEAKKKFDKSNINFEKVTTEYNLNIKNFDEKYNSNFSSNNNKTIFMKEYDENLYKKICKNKLEINNQLEKINKMPDIKKYVENLKKHDETTLTEKINEITINESKYLVGIESINEQKIKIIKEMPNNMDLSNEKPKNLIVEYNKTFVRNEDTIKLLKKQNDDTKIKFEDIRNQISRDNDMLIYLEKNKKKLDVSIENDSISFLKSLKDNNFENKEHFLENLLDTPEIEKINKEINNHENRVNSLNNENKILFKDIENRELQDIDFLEEQYKNFEKSITEQEKTFLSISVKLNNNQEQEKNIIKIYKTSAKEEEKYNVVALLSKLANGAMGDRISFERYVLSVYFSEVISASNLRFSKMTTNRYKMVHRKEKASHGSASGLDLDVFDSHTGKERNIDSLSGGESFKASLSLALGLSDVIQRRAGGVHIETMFIDEGFGTLDSQSLDSAINSLNDLQGQGKVIGIISHIAELKERIKTHVQVTNTPVGSNIELVEN